LCFPRGDIEGCLRAHRRSLELAREAGTAEQEAAALGGLGDAEYVRGGMVSAHDAFRRCVELAHRRGLGRIEVANRPMMAFTQWLVGDTRGALGESLAAIAAATRVGHLRAQMIAHHAAYLCRHSLMQWPEAWGHAESALALARQLGARRFEAEALAFQAELHRVAGRRSEALADVQQALSISRETGMAFLGPMILGALALAADDGAVRDAALAEAGGLLAAGSVSHNHFLFRRNAIEACLGVGAWDRAEQHAAALEDYARREPSTWTGFVVARGRTLAEHGRGDGGPTLMAELVRLKEEGERIGHLDALPAIEAALSAVPAPAGSERKQTTPGFIGPAPEGP
jgi:tetratricopeptide (TPR) repeat protein